jgi:hypothetical protein
MSRSKGFTLQSLVGVSFVTICVALLLAGCGGGQSAASSPHSSSSSTSSGVPSTAAGSGSSSTSSSTSSNVPSTAAGSGLGDSLAWSQSLALAPGNIENGATVSCPSAYFCAAGADDAVATMVNGQWSPVTAPVPGGNSPVAVSCVSATFCGAVSYQSAFTYEDGTWTAPVTIDLFYNNGNNGFIAISCTSTDFCMAVDWSGNVFTYNGQSWTSGTLVDGYTNGGGTTIGGISCASPQFCMVVDSGGNNLVYDGQTWTNEPHGISSNGVACVDAACFVSQDVGIVAKFQNGAWTQLPQIEQNGEGVLLYATSCLSGTRCWVGGGYGTGDAVYMWNGSKWSSGLPAFTGANGAIYSVSCPSRSLCLAGDQGGAVFRGSPT